MFSTLFYTWAFPSIPLHKHHCYPPFSIHGRFSQFLYISTIFVHLFSIHGRVPQFLYINTIGFLFFYAWTFPSIPLHKHSCVPPFSIHGRFPQFPYKNTIVFHLFSIDGRVPEFLYINSIVFHLFLCMDVSFNSIT